MANYSTLKAAVADVVKTNGTQAITGANLQTVLLSIINSVGGGGYIFKGVATPSTDAGTPDENVFYVGGAGTYANFGTSVTVPVGSIGVFKYNGSWTKEQIALFAGIDDVPTNKSDNLVKSGGVYSFTDSFVYERIDLFNLNYLQGSLFQNNPDVSNTNCIYCPNYIPLKGISTITISNEKQQDGKWWSVRVCFVDANRAYISQAGYSFTNGDWSINVPANAEYMRFTISLINADGTDLPCTPADIPTDGTKLVVNNVLKNDTIVLESKISDLQNSGVFDFDILKSDYLQGSLYADNPTGNTKCIYCPTYYEIGDNPILTIKNEKQQDGKWWSVRVCFVDESKTYISQSQTAYTFINGDWSINVPANARYVRFSISLINADGTDADCTPADIPTDGTQIITKNISLPSISDLNYEISTLKDEVCDILKLDYLQGSLYRDNPIGNTKCIYCPTYFELGENSILTIKNGKQQDGKWWSVRVCFVDASKTYISQYGFSFVDGTTKILIPVNARYVRFTISLINADGTDADCTPADIPTDGTQIIVSNITNAYLTQMQTYVDDLQTDVIYLQKNIKPLPLNSLLGYSFTNMYDITRGQGCGCYNGVIFQFINGNEYVYVHDAADGSLIQTITMSNPNQNYHNNNVNFGSLKYDDADEFPLIYASQEASSENKCIVYRITGSRGNYSMTVVQTINYPSNDSTHLYYQNCYIDNKNGYILISGIVNYPWSETANNNIRYLAFTLPPITQSSVTLQISDVLFMSDVFDKMPTTQGGICKNGLLYQTFGVYPPQLLNVYDIENCKMCYTFSLTEEIANKEPEGIFEYNNKIYIVLADGGVYKLL